MWWYIGYYEILDFADCTWCYRENNISINYCCAYFSHGATLILGLGTLFNDVTEEHLNTCMCMRLNICLILTSINIRALFYKTKVHQPQMDTYRSTFNVSVFLSIPIPKSFKKIFFFKSIRHLGLVRSFRYFGI